MGPADAETGTFTENVCSVVEPQETIGLMITGAVDSVI